jgi:hypothetical protein
VETVGENRRDIAVLVGDSAKARDWIATQFGPYGVAQPSVMSGSASDSHVKLFGV